MRVVRVFPRRTAQTPTDPMAFVGAPPLIRPEADEVHVSVTFTWDKPVAESLAEHWRAFYPVVRIGGPAYDDPAGEFTGRYTRPGVTFTSRGCPNDCWFCFVPKREGKLRELTNIVPGNIVQDNNLTACSSVHLDRVFAMLATQHGVEFAGGLEAARVTPRFIDRLRDVSLRQLFLAYDSGDRWPIVRRAFDRLTTAGLRRRQLRCFVLSGFDGDSVDAAEARCEQVWDTGGLPFVQLYVGVDGVRRQEVEWRQFARKWSRPAAMFANHKPGGD